MLRWEKGNLVVQSEGKIARFVRSWILFHGVVHDFRQRILLSALLARGERVKM